MPTASTNGQKASRAFRLAFMLLERSRARWR